MLCSSTAARQRPPSADINGCKPTLAFRSMLDTLPKVKHASRRASSSLAATPMTQTWWVGSRSLLDTRRVKHRCCSLQLIVILGISPQRCQQSLWCPAVSFVPLLPRASESHFRFLFFWSLKEFQVNSKAFMYYCNRHLLASPRRCRPPAAGHRKAEEYPRFYYLRISQQKT